MKVYKTIHKLLVWMSMSITCTLIVHTGIYAAPEPAPPPVTSGDIERNLMDAGAGALPEEDSPKALIEDLKVEQTAKGHGESQLPESVQFVLKGINIKGNTVLKQNDIVSIVQPFIDQPANAYSLQQIANEITGLYASKGYVTSRCIIPPQKAVAGVVVLKMEENRLGRIILTGKNSYRYEPGLFTRYLHDLQGQVIHQDTLNARLIQLARLPVTRVTPRLQAETKSVTNLVLDIKDSEDEYSLGFDNQGGEFFGTNRMTLNARYSNYTGHGDPLAIRVLLSMDEVKFLNSTSFDYVRPVGEEAGRIRTYLEKTQYQLDTVATGISDKLYNGKSTTLKVGYEEPFLLEQGDYWWHLGLEHKRVSSATMSNEDNAFYEAGEDIVDGKDVLTVLRLGVHSESFDHAISNWIGRNVMSLEVKYSLEGFLGSMTQEDIDHKIENLQDPSVIKFVGPIGDVEGLDPAFTKLYFNYTRQQSLPYSLMMFFNTAIEYTGSKKTPESYKFVGAGGGTNGYNASLGVAHNFGWPQFQTALSYNVASARSYQNNSWLTNDADTFMMTLSYNSKKWSAYYTVLSDAEDFDTVDKEHRLYISRRW